MGVRESQWVCGNLNIRTRRDDHLRVMVSKGLSPDVVERTEMKIDEGISGHVALHGQPLIVENVEAHPTFRRRNRERYYTSTLISAPLLRNGVLLGEINISAASQLVDVADAEFYRAKSLGRNRTCSPGSS